MRYLFLLMLVSPYTFAQSFDQKWAEKINKNGVRSLDKSLNALSSSTGFLAIGTPLVLLTAGYVKNDNQLKKKGIETSLGVLSTYGIAYILKKKIDRSRPYETNKRIKNYKIESPGSFPSGSTSLAFVNATNLSLAFPKWYVAVPAYAYAAGVGYARLHLGAHYPSDVLAGAVLGTSSAFLSRGLNNLIRNTVRKRKAKNELDQN